MHKIYAAVLRYKKQLRLISVVFLDDAGPFSAAWAATAADATADDSAV